MGGSRQALKGEIIGCHLRGQILHLSYDSENNHLVLLSISLCDLIYIMAILVISQLFRISDYSSLCFEINFSVNNLINVITKSYFHSFLSLVLILVLSYVTY